MQTTATVGLLSILAGLSGSIVPTAVAAETQPVTLRFLAKVGKQPVSCGATYRLGKPATHQTLTDFRFYISEVALIDARGKTVPVALEQDSKWQYQTVALLDFENKTGACANGTPELRDRIIGTVPTGTYTGLKFTLGVPASLNHADTALAPSPLNLTSLWWNWQSGYKFLRIDLKSADPMPMMKHHPQKPEAKGAGQGEAGIAGFPIHLGSTGCHGGSTSEKPMGCSNPNRASVRLTGFNPEKNVVVLDLAELVSKSPLNHNQPKTSPGCMSDPADRDCIGIMASLGLPFMGKPASPQTIFRIE
ncbi:metallo-mystery pair system four-Cys motif protein [Leptolyngbya sp. 'hensonii']|nr:metallo-mystery pair system four-Cys motif protein [Leptolyngbya sp. 'hensonii']